MPESTASAEKVIAYLKAQMGAQIAELSGELAFTRSLLDTRTEERDQALADLHGQPEAPK